MLQEISCVQEVNKAALLLQTQRELLQEMFPISLAHQIYQNFLFLFFFFSITFKTSCQYKVEGYGNNGIKTGGTHKLNCFSAVATRLQLCSCGELCFWGCLSQVSISYLKVRDFRADC